MSIRHPNPSLQFLSGGGEMGALTREKDWSKTPVGDPLTWPQSLRTTLGILLSSKFPMFLFWGKELTCFYNDAYRPSLGSNGKHPSILGQDAKTAWEEIWPVIKPLIDQVLAGGEATWSEDQLIPIYRNGKLEDVYWTFSYSPVNDESGSVAGVLVTCSETTEKVKLLIDFEERAEQLNFTLDAAEIGTWDFNPATSKFIGNRRLKEWFGLKADDEIDLSLAVKVMHENDRQRVTDAIADAIAPGSDGHYQVDYTIINPLTGKERRILAKGKAVFTDEGIATRFSGTLQDITEQYNARKKTEESEKEFRQLADSLPTLVWTTDAQGVQTFASRRWKEFTGLDPYDRNTFEAIVHPDDFEGIIARWSESLVTGDTYTTQVRLRHHDGSYHWFFVNGEPLKNQQGVIEKWVGTFATINEQKITEQNLTNALHQAAESDKRFRNTVKQAPLGITILRGKDFIVEMANETYLQLVDRQEETLVGKPLFDSLPEVKDIVNPLLNEVLKTGVAFHAAELSVMLHRHGTQEHGYFNLVYHPLKDNDVVTGIMVVATEVTESVRAKHALAESEKQFRNLVMQSPIPMTIFRGPDHVVEMANSIMFEKIWRRERSEVIGKPLLEVFPELRDQKYEALLNTVYTTGQTHTEKEAIAHVQGNDGLRTFYLDFEYSPLFDTENKVLGLIVTVNDVTEQVIARIKVEENERRLNIVIDSSELGTWEWNLVTNEMIYSKRYLEIFNYRDDESMLHHKNHLAHIHQDDIPIRAKAMGLAMETGILAYEARIIWQDGSVHWMEARGKVFYDEEDGRKPVKMIGTIRDITAEKNHQQVLLENEQRFRLLADSMPQHIWTADTAGNLNYYNKSVFDYSGLTPEKISEVGWLDIVHPDDREANLSEWVKAISTGNDFLIEHRFRRYDGQYRWQLSRALPQRDAHGNIQMWVGTSTDIEDQKTFTTELERQVRERTSQLMSVNESLAQSEQRYHLMVEEVEEYAILYLSREGIVENWNKGAEKIKGYSAEEIIGKSFSIFYPEQERKNKLPEYLLNEATTKGKSTHEGFRVRKNGSLFWASVALTAVHDENGEVIGFSKVTHDLTDKKIADDQIKQNAEQLAQKNKDLEKMNAELQSFAYVSSHDLQEPLRKIQTFASRILSKEKETLSENGKDYFRRMQDAAGRMQTLIQDLLAYSRTSTTDRAFEKTDLGRIIQEVQLDIKETHVDKKVEIEVSATCHANVIPFQFRQLMYNLISNAIKFARPGVAPHIRVESKTVKGNEVKTEKLLPQTMYCHISVTDNGIGFDPQYKKRIFEVFQRLHGKDEYSGTGIGLAIVKKIVDNHNGAISATGELNKGARFDVYIPV